MSSSLNRRINPDFITDAQAVLAALKTVKGYTPANSAFGVEALEAAFNEMLASQTAETQTEAAFKAARDTAVQKEWAFHTLALGAKDQIIAQFGRDSDEAQAVGLKKKSERKKPERKSKSQEE
jgi:hypothetical protein